MRGKSRKTVIGKPPCKSIVSAPTRWKKFHLAIKFEFSTSNNEAEYEAFLAERELAIAFGAKKIVIYSDSQLVVNQIQGSYEAREEKMVKYLLKAKEMLNKFEESSVQVSRIDNVGADRLDKLASSMAAIRSRRITFSHQIGGSGAIGRSYVRRPNVSKLKRDIVKFLTQGTTPTTRRRREL
ncbi:UNVERIFIED_CONTAM: hypothetical protein Sangu_2875000 [Sesamum angustifolium]|uniref:RNase H type-1 domain-containing protein n=1 Tax=Sesamum angustifolium TaxID=2727405 RepID=A0AAW2INR3_9LAMI